MDDNYKIIRNLTKDNKNLKIKLEEKENLLEVAKNTIRNLNKFGIILKSKSKDFEDDLR